MLLQIESGFSDRALETAKQFNERYAKIEAERTDLDGKLADLATADPVTCNVKSHRARHRELLDAGIELDRKEISFLSEVGNVWPEIFDAEREAQRERAVENLDEVYKFVRDGLLALGYESAPTPGVPQIISLDAMARINPVVVATRNDLADAKLQRPFNDQSLLERIAALESKIRTALAA